MHPPNCNSHNKCMNTTRHTQHIPHSPHSPHLNLNLTYTQRTYDSARTRGNVHIVTPEVRKHNAHLPFEQQHATRPTRTNHTHTHARTHAHVKCLFFLFKKWFNACAQERKRVDESAYILSPSQQQQQQQHGQQQTHEEENSGSATQDIHNVFDSVNNNNKHNANANNNYNHDDNNVTNDKENDNTFKNKRNNNSATQNNNENDLFTVDLLLPSTATSLTTTVAPTATVTTTTLTRSASSGTAKVVKGAQVGEVRRTSLMTNNSEFL